MPDQIVFHPDSPDSPESLDGWVFVQMLPGGYVVYERGS